MGRQVVEDDDVSGAEGGREEGLGIGGEGRAVHGAVDDHRRREAVEAEAGDERRRLRVAVRDGGPAAFALGAAPAQAGHLGGRTGLVDEDELRRVELGLELEPDLAALDYVRTLLLTGVGGLLWNGPPLRRRYRIASREHAERKGARYGHSDRRD